LVRVALPTTFSRPKQTERITDLLSLVKRIADFSFATVFRRQNHRFFSIITFDLKSEAA
jgi:hypothetical protein